jgi:hypothetical protein
MSLGPGLELRVPPLTRRGRFCRVVQGDRQFDVRRDPLCTGHSNLCKESDTDTFLAERLVQQLEQEPVRADYLKPTGKEA